MSIFAECWPTHKLHLTPTKSAYHNCQPSPHPQQTKQASSGKTVYKVVVSMEDDT